MAHTVAGWWYQYVVGPSFAIGFIGIIAGAIAFGAADAGYWSPVPELEATYWGTMLVCLTVAVGTVVYDNFLKGGEPR